MKKIISLKVNEIVPTGSTYLGMAKETSGEFLFFYEQNLKEDTKEKRANNHKEEIEEIIAYLNRVTASGYTSKSKATRDLILARINEGRTVDDFKAVIDVKSSEWLTDERFSNYLRPQTLFGNKFDSYLSQSKRDENKVDPMSDLEDFINNINRD